MLARIFAGYDDYELRDLATDHPFVELGHNFLNVGFDLVVRGDKHCEAIFFDPGGLLDVCSWAGGSGRDAGEEDCARCEVFGGIDASLEAV